MSIKARVKPAWPTLVQGEGGVTITQTNGRAIVGFDYDTSEMGAQLTQAVDAAANSATTALGAQTGAEAAQEGAEAAQAAAELASGSLLIASQEEGEEGTINNKGMSPLRVTQRIRVIGGEINVIDFVPYATSLVGPDTAAGINSALTYALANNLNLYIPGAIWPLDVPIDTPDKMIRIRGEQGRGQPTILYKRYAEPSSVKGIVSLSTHGGELLDLQFAAAPGASGGSSISATLPGNAANVGVLRLENIYSSCNDGTNFAVLISGAENVAPGGPGYRNVFANNLQLFGAKIGGLALIDVHHFFCSNIFLATTGGSVESGYILDISGSDIATRYNDDIHIHSGIIAGNAQVGYLSRSTFMAPVTGALTYNAHCDAVSWLSVAGGVIGTATNSCILKENAIIAKGGDHVNGWQRHGDGRLEQWGVTAMNGSGTGTATFAVPFGVPPQDVRVKIRDALTNPITYLPVATAVNATATVLTLAAHSIAVATGVVTPLSANVHWRAIGL